MIRLGFDQLSSVTQGKWLRPPCSSGAVHGVEIDSRRDLDGRLFIALSGERLDGHDFVAQAVDGGAAAVAVEREIDSGFVPDHVPILLIHSARDCLARLAVHHRATLRSTRVIAITGSAGKTTTKSLLHAILRAELRGTCAPESFNNDIGVPLTMLAASPDDDYLIVEVGTNAPGEIDHLGSLIRPDIAIITSIGRAHLEGLGSQQGVIEEKQSLLDHVVPGGWCLVPEGVRDLRSAGSRSEVVVFGESSLADPRLTDRHPGPGGQEFEVNGCRHYFTPLHGRHNALNTMIALAVGLRMGLGDSRLRSALATATGPPMRFQHIDVAGITVFNDAYNANPDSVLASVSAFLEVSTDAQRRIIILGDMLELGPKSAMLHREVGEELASLTGGTEITQLILVGRLAAHVAAGFKTQEPVARIQLIEGLTTSSIEALRESLEPGDSVLIKGSRGARLERIVEAMQARSSSPPVALTGG